jgi:hypothetical protein
MSLNATRARLEGTTKDLARSWDETRNAWRDSKAADFDQLYMEELKARVGKAASVIEKLDTLLAKVQDDCE